MSNIIPAIFVSNWREGSIQTPCDININSFQILNIVDSDELDEVDELINEEILIPEGGKIIPGKETKYVSFLAVFDEFDNQYYIDNDEIENFKKTISK